MKNLVRIVSTLLFTLIINIFSFAQTGKIAGLISDGTTGEPLPFVNILIVGTTQGAASDINGYYSIIGLSPGTYSIRASAIGYNPVTTQNVKVSIDLTTEINFDLLEASVELEEEVVVVATRPLVTKDLTSSTAIITSDEISVLPVTEFQEILKLQAGIVGRDGNVRGGRGGEVVYAIDGVPVTDSYDGSTVIDVNTNSIQELQFVSGAFNAEYGKALSGYVNIATKDGGDDFVGSITSYIGDYISTYSDSIFRGIGDINAINIRNIEGSLSGPIIPGTLTFYAYGRYIYFGGWRNGQKNYNPWNITINRGPDFDVEDRYILIADSTTGAGDGEIVSMNWNEKIYAQGKLTYKVVSGLKLNANFLIDDVHYRDYDHSFAYNPDGDFKRYRRGITGIFSATHTMSPNAFYQANFSYFNKLYQQYVYEDVNDPRWTHDLLLDQEPKEVPSFKTGGTQNSQLKRTTQTYGFKLDFTSQIDRINLIKIGVEANKHQLDFEDITLLQELGVQDPSISGTPYVKRHIPNPQDPNENLSIDIYTREPIELSVYLQDKIELGAMIINLGVRGDYFETNGLVLNDPTDPDIYRPRNPANTVKTLEERYSSNANGEPWYRDPDPSFQVSPRLGVAFPITDQGVFHFSYGHFFQIPNFELLYQNPEYKFEDGTQNIGVAGNPNLKPQQTISGEVGLQQAFTNEVTADITMYFRDIRNLAGTRADEIRIFGGAASYSQLVNSDFGFVTGIVLSISKRLSNNWAATIDYTFQEAKGNASDPEATRNQIAGGEQPEIKLLPLDWDQSHTLNFTFTYSSLDLWGFSFIGQYGSGFPYSPDFSLNVSSLLTNSALKPSSFNIDLRAYKDFLIGTMRLTIFTRVYNLFDIRNEVDVYTDTGTADYSLEEYQRRQQGNPPIVNSFTEYYRNPTYYSEPRRIEVGASFYF